ncbi:MAG: efflux RND transporter permease subunit [bacterium]
MFEFSVRRPVTIAIVTMGIILLGLFLGAKLNIDMFPEMDIPVVTISTAYPGVGPEEIEDQVTKPIEEAVGTIGNLKKISSSSMENLSIVALEFRYGTNMIEAVSNVREKLDAARSKIPSDAKPPVVVKADMAATAVLRLVLSGEKDLRTLRTIADQDIKKDLERVAGVASVTITGGLERNIIVEVDRDKLEKYNLPIQQVVSALQAENINLPGGKLTTTKLEFQVRTVGEFKAVEDLPTILVGMAGNKPVYLRDVALVKDTFKEIKSKSRLNGQPCVTLDIRRNSDANVVRVCDAVREALIGINQNLPSGTKLLAVFDQSEYIKNAIDNMKEEAVEGALLAIAIIFLFLASGRSTLIIALSIPTSIIATFILMYFRHLSINMITLAGFTLGIGRIVDDSIVVLENIHRHMEMGKPRMQAAIDGAQEVGLAVLASTFTTISVFLPLFLVKGFVGQIFTPLSWTFAFALICSLVVAITVIPMLSARLISVGSRERKTGLLGRILNSWNEFWKKLDARYRLLLEWALGHRRTVVVSTFAIFVVSLVMMGLFVQVEMAPKMDHGRGAITIETPIGSSLQRTDDVVRQVEEIIRKSIPEMRDMIADAGKSPSGTMSMGADQEKSRMGGVTFYLVPSKQRKRSIFMIQDEIHPELKKIPGATIRIEAQESLSSGKPIEVIIKGDNLNILSQLGLSVKKVVENVPGIIDADLNWRAGNPEYRVVMDRVKAAHLGLNLAQVALTLRTLVNGEDATKFKEAGKEFDITVRLPESQRGSLEDVKNISILTPKGIRIPLREISTIKLEGGPTEISRQDRTRYVSVQASLSGRPSGACIMDITRALSSMTLPDGYTWEMGGEEKDRQEAFGDLWSSLAMGFILVYVILACQFESFIHPLTIMMAVPLEMIGVSLALILFRENLGITVILGLIMLTGIVISNSILLVNYIIILRGRGMSRKEAILTAGPVRLRPILMTASATVLAMIPMALGIKEGSEMFVPLAKAVIGGLLTSTALTLLVVPVVYTLLDDLSRRLGLTRDEGAHPEVP